MKTNLFFSTKPLQYVNCVNIPKSDSIHNEVVICNQFYGAKDFYEIAKNDGQFTDYRFLKNKECALLACLFKQHRIKSLYLDSDFGLFVRLLLVLFCKVNVFVYEEGYASYLPLRSGRTKQHKFMLLVQKILKINNYNGGGMHTKGIYLYMPDKFRKQFPACEKPIFQFKLSFYEAVEKCYVLDMLFQNFDVSKYKEKNVLVYLSSWEVSEEAIEYCKLANGYDYKLLKLHPNIKNIKYDNLNLFDAVLPNNVMFEYIYAKLHNIVKSMHIVHHGTFAVEYIDFSGGNTTQRSFQL